MINTKFLIITISVSAVAISLYCLYKINKIESNIGLIYNKLSKLETQKTESNNTCPINYSKNVVKSNISQSFKSNSEDINSLSNKEKEINDLKKEINEMEDIVYDSGSDGDTDESVEELENMSDNLNEEHKKDSDSNSVKESLKDLDKKITENIENNILSQKSKDDKSVHDKSVHDKSVHDKSVDDKSTDETNNYEIKENNIILDNNDKDINKELVQLINENTNNQTIDLNNYMEGVKEKNNKSEFDELDNSETDMNSELCNILENKDTKKDSESLITKDIFLQHYTKNQLRDLCSHNNLQISGNKSILLDRLLENNISLETNNKPGFNLPSQI
jgi:hypothetical protein